MLALNALREKLRFGTASTRSPPVSICWAFSASLVSAVTAIGTLCSDSERFWAVTITSCTVAPVSALLAPVVPIALGGLGPAIWADWSGGGGAVWAVAPVARAGQLAAHHSAAARLHPTGASPAAEAASPRRRSWRQRRLADYPRSSRRWSRLFKDL